jgi:hypothetical protein
VGSALKVVNRDICKLNQSVKAKNFITGGKNERRFSEMG